MLEKKPNDQLKAAKRQLIDDLNTSSNGKNANETKYNCDESTRCESSGTADELESSMVNEKHNDFSVNENNFFALFSS